MYIKVSYEQEFTDYMMYLKSKYPKELFELEGIGDQLDMGKFSRSFFLTKNVADVSVDSNSNVDENTVKAYESELPKPYFRLNSLYLIWKYLRKLYNTQQANNFLESQITGDIYVNDATGVNSAYCFNFSTYNIMMQGLPFVTKIKSEPPKHLSSFIGQLIHFTVYASNSVLGAVGLADLLVISSYYIKKMLDENPEVPTDYKWKQIKQELQSFIFSCNQPFRGGIQSGFYNLSIYDDNFLDKMCEEYIFPDGSAPNKELIKTIQELYLDIMNNTLETTPVTFPVTTACFSIDDDKNILDHKFLDMISKKNVKYGFINIYSGKTSTLSSCCRLRSESDNQYFNQFGAGGTQIGSLGVVTVNIPRLAFKYKDNKDEFFRNLEDLTRLANQINNAKRHILQKRIDDNRAPLYKHGFMFLEKQYSTVGVLGLYEATLEFGLNILEEDGQSFIIDILNTVNHINDQAAKKYNAPHNCEQVPAENSSIKLAKKDQLLKYQEIYNLYSNQFIPLILNADLLDRIKLQGLFDGKMSGGAIAHLNIEQQITDHKQLSKLIITAVKMGVVYHAINYNIQRCENEHMSVGKDNACVICGGEITDNFTRVVGFLTNVKNWHRVRRVEDYPNRKFYGDI